MSEANPSGASQLSVVRGRRIYLEAMPSISQKVGKAELVKGQNDKARLHVDRAMYLKFTPLNHKVNKDYPRSFISLIDVKMVV